MKYLIQIIGSLGGENKTKFQDKIKEIILSEPLTLRYLTIGDNNIIIYVDSQLPIVKIKDIFKVMCHELNSYYFIIEHTANIFMNLNDDDSRHLFGISFQDIESMSDEDIKPIFMDLLLDDDDDDDDDLVQDLKEKYLLKKEEPSLDEILDKIIQGGITSLSVQEKSILNNYN